MKTTEPNQPIRTILVVDDMSMCREAVVDILRSRGYRVLAACSGEEGLELIGAGPPDLILLDVVMPGLDGIGVLTALRKSPRWQSLPVILLTDRADRDLVRRAAMLHVHGYILKSSFTPDELLSRVSQCLTLDGLVDTGPGENDTSRSATAADSAGGIGPPPAIPAVAPASPGRAFKRGTWAKNDVFNRVRRVLEVRPIPPVMQYIISQTNSSATTIHDVANTVRQDQALALRVMKVANSSYYCTGRRVQTLNEAASRLGMAGIRNAIVAVVGIDHFADIAESGLIPQRFWEHSLATAAIGQRFAEAMHRDDAEDIFLAGLLHDIGRLALAQAFPGDYRELLERSRETDTPLTLAEREHFEVDHADVTREVLEYLKLPKHVVKVASRHHQPARQILSSPQDPKPTLILGLANQLSHVLLLGDSGDNRLASIAEYTRPLGIDAPSAASIGLQIVDRISETEIFYASQGGSTFLAPLACELAGAVTPRPRVEVLSSGAPHDVLSLFFDRLGWRVSEKPTVVVLSAGSQAELEQHLGNLRRRTGSLHAPLTILVISETPSLNLPNVDTEWSVASINLPASCTEILSRVDQVSNTMSVAD